MKKVHLYLFVFFISSIHLFSQLTVSIAGSLNNPRWMHESQVLPNGNVFAFGGDNGDLTNKIVLNSSETYNPVSNSWSLSANLNIERTDFSSALLNDGMVIAIGGNNQSFNALTSCELYNYNTNSWNLIASLNEPRAYHKAVKLKDGRVLVVGGNSNTNTAEVYDPYSNTWQYTDTLNKRHGSGIAAVLLIDGRVLVTGGVGAPTILEIFNPVNNSWTQVGNNLITGRSYHNMVTMPDGTVFITAGESTRKKTEMFIPSTSQIFSNGNLQTAVGDNKTIAMDDGKVLIYGIGDFSLPSNTKCLQTMSSPSYTWSTGTYNFTGADNYCINKLHNGQILINGGNFTTGNGATTNCKLIGIASYSGCVLPNLNLTVNSINSCYGKTSTVTVQSSEAGVTYSASIAGVIAGAGVNGNGGTINLPIPSTMIQPGNNIVSVIARKGGCNLNYLNNNAVINSSLSITGTPTINPSGTILICAGDSLLLNASAGYPSYIWSNLSGTTTASSIYVKPNKTLTVKYVDASGCMSIPSLFVKVFTPSSAYGGPLVNICNNATPFQLTGNTPVGGSWSGPGVSSTGVFTPTAVGVGSYTLMYSICTQTSNRIIKVYPSTVPTYSASFTATSICAAQSNTLQIQNSSIGVKYQLRNGSIMIGASQNGNGGILNFNTGSLTSSATLNMLSVTTTTCGVDTLIRYHYALVKPSYNTKITAKDSLICLGKKALIIIDSAQTGVTYQLQTLSGTNMYNPKIGDGDSVAITVGPINSYSVFNVRAYYPGCSYVNTTFDPAVNVQRPYVYFAPSKFNIQPNEYIKFNNNSVITGSDFNWNFDSGSSIATSTLALPDSINYSTAGTKKIVLNTVTTIGCKDSLIQLVNVFNYTPGICHAGRSAAKNGMELWSLNNDKNDNTYSFMSTYSTLKTLAFSINNDTLKQNLPYDNNINYSHALMKHDKHGIPQWNVKIRHSSTWTRPGNIDFDSLGNVYVTYYHGYHIGYIYFYSVDNSFLKYSPPYNANEFSTIICKYNPQGYVQWVKSYLENSTSSSTIKIDPKGYIYAGSDRHYNKYDMNGSLIWGLTSVAPMNGGVKAIDIDTLGNSYVLKMAAIGVDKYNSAGNMVFSTVPYTSLDVSSQVQSSHLKMEKQYAYMAGIFKGKIKFADDTFIVNKNPGMMYVDGYVASTNVVTGQQNWLIQMRFKGNFILITGLDFKNGKGLVTGHIYNTTNDTLWVKNQLLPMSSGGSFSFNFDSLGSISNLTKLNADIYVPTTYPRHLLKYNYLDSNVTYGFMYNNTLVYGGNAYPLLPAHGNSIIIKGDLNCFSSVITGVNAISDNYINGMSVFVFPNPKDYSQELNVAFESNSDRRITLTLVDISGRLINQEVQLNISSGINNITLPKELSTQLKPGMYFLSFKSNDFNKTVKLLIN